MDKLFPIPLTLYVLYTYYVRTLGGVVLEKNVTYQVRVPESLKDAFLSASRSKDMDGSQLIRAFMREYIQRHSQGDLLESLSLPAKKRRN